jgi:hypothetical protein
VAPDGRLEVDVPPGELTQAEKPPHAAADDVARPLGYGAATNETIERGSFRRRARAQPRQGVEPDEVRSRPRNALKALTTATLSPEAVPE